MEFVTPSATNQGKIASGPRKTEATGRSFLIQQERFLFEIHCPFRWETSITTLI